MEDKQLRCIFNIPKWTWPPGSPSSSPPPAPAPTCYRAWLAHPSSTLNFSAGGLGFPSPRSSSLYNEDILSSPSLFLSLHLLSRCVCTLLLSFLSPPLYLPAAALVLGTRGPAQEWLLNKSAFIYFNLAWTGSFHQQIIASILTENNMTYNFTIVRCILKSEAPRKKQFCQ